VAIAPPAHLATLLTLTMFYSSLATTKIGRRLSAKRFGKFKDENVEEET